MMSRLLACVLLVLGFPALASEAREGEPCLDLSCLVCPDARDPAKYEGTMKMVNFLALGRDQWLFRSVVDFDADFGVPKEFEPELARLVRTFNARGTDLMFVVQPTRGVMHRDKILPDHAYGFDYPRARRNLEHFVGQLRRSGALVPDILPLVDNPPQDEYFFRRDTHWTPSGARATAEVAATMIRAQPFYAELPKKQFRTEPGVTIVNYGVLDRALRALCHNDFGNQYLRGYRTVPVVEDDAAALFDDQGEPEVVLTGTSNSASRDEEIRHFNFDGYLKEFTELDILNYAMQGAGQYGALIEYLHSDDYDPDKAPRLIVWELPASYRLDGESMYRQLIPAINGGCAKGTELARQRSEVPVLQTGERAEILNNSGSGRQDFTGLEGFLEIRLSDKNLHDFYLITYYDNGERDKVRIRRPGVVTGGLYRMELSRAESLRSANLLSVLLEATEPLEAPLQADVQLCR